MKMKMIITMEIMVIIGNMKEEIIKEEEIKNVKVEEIGEIDELIFYFNYNLLLNHILLSLYIYNNYHQFILLLC